MSVGLVERPIREAERDCAGRRRDHGAGGETTLEQLISRAWEGLSARAGAACPVCGGAMVARGGHRLATATAGPGRCRDCASELS